jgi:NAD-dependent protein deacetylase/lipoamidase
VHDALQTAADALKRSSHAIAVTGAGISVESGIPSFRGTSGIWVKYPVEEFATIDAYVGNPRKVWQLWRELAEQLGDAKPHTGHVALAELETAGVLKAVITQNVDHLHQDAGSRKVIEYHGNTRHLRCLECGAEKPFDRANIPAAPPWCPACRGLMKPDVVMFGEFVPGEAMAEADLLAQQSDVVLVVGTSAQVFPAARLPYTAKEHGAYIIEANVEPTAFTEHITDAFIEGPARTTLPELARLVRESG